MYKNKKKPCANCPFKKDTLKGWLGKERATEINRDVMTDKTFHCHKTLQDKSNKKICAGSMILLEKQKGLDSNFIFRIGKHLGLISEIDKSEFDKVFDNSSDFIEHHTN